MNYVQHTRAAHECLRRQSKARPHHVSLYWALFFAWNTARFPTELVLDRRQVMATAHIGNRGTYLDTLRDLHTWGLLTYQPSHHGGSLVQLTVLGGPAAVVPEVDQPEAEGCISIGTTENAGVVPVVEQPLAQKWDNQPAPVVPEVGQHSLLDKTSLSVNSLNIGGGPQKKTGERFPGEGLSGVEILDDTAQPDEPIPPTSDRPGAAPKKKIAPKKKGVRPAAFAAAATAQPNEPRRRGGRQQRPEIPFAACELADPEAFAAAFAGTDYGKYADLRFYHLLVGNWRKDGESPLRRDWKAVATKFMTNDAHDNRLKLAPGVRPHQPGTDPHDPQNAGIPTTGYRSSRWD